MAHPDHGELRHLLTIEEPSGERTAAGGVSREYTPIGTAWCSIEAVSGREPLLARAREARVSNVIVTRWRKDLTSACRLTGVIWEKARTFNIHGVFDVEGDGRYLTLLVEERAA